MRKACRSGRIRTHYSARRAVTRNAERPLPDAWGVVARRAEFGAIKQPFEIVGRFSVVDQNALRFLRKNIPRLVKVMTRHTNVSPDHP
jgi:hypothetical protein